MARISVPVLKTWLRAWWADWQPSCAAGKKSGVRGQRKVRMADLSTGHTVQWCWLNIAGALAWFLPSVFADLSPPHEGSARFLIMPCKTQHSGSSSARYSQDPQWQNMLTYRHHLMKHVFWIPGECFMLPCQSASSLQVVSQPPWIQQSKRKDTSILLVFHLCILCIFFQSCIDLSLKTSWVCEVLVKHLVSLQP